MRRTALMLPPVMLIALALPACSNSRDAQLEKRVDKLESEQQIREVIIKYGEYLDARDYADYASLFAKDGTWTGGFGSFTGPAAIQKMLEDNMGKPKPGFINKDNFHLDTTVVVHVNDDGNTATARSRYLFFIKSADNRPVPLLAGRYFDTFVRENGQWKIKTRKSSDVIPYRNGDAPPPANPPAAVKNIMKK